MKYPPRSSLFWALGVLFGPAPFTLLAAANALIGWNNLGMHCTDGSDFSVFSILPHYNTVQAHLIVAGRLVADPAARGLTVTYEAVADADGSINRSSAGKGNFNAFVESLYGAALAPDQGLAGSAMPGPANTPQAMRFDTNRAQFVAEGIPITPYDDAGRKNFYPMMRLVARDRAGAVLATTDIVLPVSDEMTCVVCHGSGASIAAQPASGWVQDPDPARDYKLNILRLHDDFHLGLPRYATLLRQAGYSAAGLYAQVADTHQPVLCAKCHRSEALPGTGMAGVAPLTQAIHARHSTVEDPATHKPLDDDANRSSCYRCHPGAVTKCLRGAMGNAVAANGTRAIQCQSCHGSMADVGKAGRTGWLDEPKCQSCHTGTAAKNRGQIRFTSAFDTPGHERAPAEATFATNPDTPAPGFALFRFSRGHGGLQCEACHGSTHAEYPSSHPNDNAQPLKLQGHGGTIAECTACHATTPQTISGGPHGIHPVGQTWIQAHPNAAERGLGTCRNCHGADLRGSPLSRSFAERTLQTEFGTKTFWRGARIGCYSCHSGPSDDERNPNRAPVVTNATLDVSTNSAATLTLAAADPDAGPPALRIVAQPAHGTVALDGARATYLPEPGFAGTDTFTFAAWDGALDSNLGAVTVTGAPKPGAGPPALRAAFVPATGRLRLSWPAAASDAIVESCADVGFRIWSPLGAAPTRTAEGQWVVEVRPEARVRFYRLQAP
jgi:hypothetical protein